MLSAATAAQSRVAVGARTVLTQSATLFFLGIAPVAFAGMFTVSLVYGYHPFDFHTFWLAARDVLHGRSPYPASLPHVAEQKTFRPFVYPAPAAYALAPLALLPYPIANALFALIGFAAFFGALYLLGVRDWRCYGAMFAWPAVWSSLLNGAVSSLLVLGCAALWRYRSRPFVSGALVAALVVFKLYLWPLGIFLVVTRRHRAWLAAVAFAGVATIGSWSLLGFAGFRQYPRLLDRLTGLVADQSFSPYALFRAAGASAGTARLLMLAVGGVLVVTVAYLGRRGEGERAAFMVAVAASLVLTPIVWPHYLTLLLVVAALARPTLGGVWLWPAALWPVMPAWSGGNPLLIGTTLAVCAAVVVSCVRTRHAPAAATARLFELGLER